MRGKRAKALRTIAFGGNDISRSSRGKQYGFSGKKQRIEIMSQPHRVYRILKNLYKRNIEATEANIINWLERC